MSPLFPATILYLFIPPITNSPPVHAIVSLSVEENEAVFVAEVGLNVQPNPPIGTLTTLGIFCASPSIAATIALGSIPSPRLLVPATLTPVPLYIVNCAPACSV